jgi:hypothetical protein
VDKSFNADFYVTCATVIPVLFLAVAVQGRAFDSALRAYAQAEAEAAAPARGRWTQQLRTGIVSDLSALASGGSVMAGGFGEALALFALYSRSDVWLARLTVLLLTLLLVVVVAAGPFLAWWRIQMADAPSHDQAGAGDEGEPTED